MERSSAMGNGGLAAKQNDLELGPPVGNAISRGLRTGFALSLGSLTALCFIILAIFAKYPTELGDEHVSQYYHYLTGVLIMVFIGFGFLMTFLRRYALSAVGLNFVLSALMMVGSIFCVGWAQQGFGTFEVDLPVLVDSAFCAAAGMISFGSVIGFASPTQLVWLLAAEVPLYAANFYIVTRSIGTFDVGGSITIHAFGAFYGLAASYFLSRSSRTLGADHPKSGSNYVSDVTSMIGTIFLWVYWPSFNAALASSTGDGSPEHQIFVVANTLISLLGACLATFIVSAALNDSLDAVHVQNATLAGGVAIGTAAALRIAPAAAFAVGLIAGTLSTLGFTFATPVVQRTLGICDTCGVHNLHGMPGVFGGIVSAILISIYYTENSGIVEKSSSSAQAGAQIAGLAATLGIAIAGGLIVGYITSHVRVPKLAKDTWMLENGEEDDLYEDNAVWRDVDKEE
jgi:ammonium transporter Rh